jgi:hypothetical protein
MKRLIAGLMLVSSLVTAPAHAQSKYVRVFCYRINGWLTCDCTSPGGEVFEAECGKEAVGELTRRLHKDCAAGDQDACKRAPADNGRPVNDAFEKAAEAWRKRNGGE